MLWVNKYEAPWCAKCKQMEPQLRRLMADNPYLDVQSVNVDAYPEKAKENGVRSLPTLIVYDNGVEVGRFSEITEGFLSLINSESQAGE